MAADWNGRFLGLGDDSSPGGLPIEAMIGALAAGYAVAATDAGLPASGFDWVGDAGALRDFAYRAVYEMTAKSDAIVAAWFGQPADYRYFTGCSFGGMQGLIEAENFPGNYDGIVAGAPLSDFVAVQATQLWLTASAGGTARLDRGLRTLVNEAAVDQCDGLDGVRDGILEDPRRCGFDPGRLQCGAGQGGSCLSATQTAAFRDIYRGPVVETPDAPVNLPGLAIGSELYWEFTDSGQPSALTIEWFRRAVLRDPSWTWQDFNLAADYATAAAELGWIFDAASGDLARFRDGGGKLILYHGFNDVVVAPEATIAYYETMESRLARQANPRAITMRDFARLFMVPGMAHCAGGPGTDQFDMQRAIEDWVERGLPPARVEASRVVAGEVERTRPLCPFPETARYRGSGNSDRSGSFVCEL
jgi:feruloyl esterase